jgi:hypothetical protein
MRIVFEVIKKRLMSFSETVNVINNGSFPVITPEEWEIITETL